MDQELRSNLGLWLWLGIPHKAVVQMPGRGAVIRRISWGWWTHIKGLSSTFGALHKAILGVVITGKLVSALVRQKPQHFLWPSFRSQMTSLPLKFYWSPRPTLIHCGRRLQEDTNPRRQGLLGEWWKLAVTFALCFPPMELVSVGDSSKHKDCARWQEENFKKEEMNQRQ